MPRHERVSLEQIRAKRLAVEAEQAEQAEQAKSSQNETNEANEAVEPQAVVEASTASTGQLSPESLPEPAAASQPNPVAQQSSNDAPSPYQSTPIPPAAQSKLPDLDTLLNSATPEQLQRIKALATAKGLTPPVAAASRKMPDGSMTVAVYLEPSVVEQLELWAESDACTLVEEAQKRITEALTNYLYGDWSAIIEQPPAPVAAPAAVPAAAAK